MSVDALFWALHQRVERPSDKLTLLCLANYANHDGLAYPSVAKLCLDTSLDRKTVLAALKRLVEGGWIADTGKRAGHTKGVVVYRMVPKPAPLSDAENGTVPAEAVPLFPPSGPVFPEKQSQKRDTEPKKEEPVKDPKGERAPRATWLTAISEVYEQRKGPGTFPFEKAAKLLKPLKDAGHTSDEIALRLGRYLDQLDDQRFLSLARFRESFGDYADGTSTSIARNGRPNPGEQTYLNARAALVGGK